MIDDQRLRTVTRAREIANVAGLAMSRALRKAKKQETEGYVGLEREVREILADDARSLLFANVPVPLWAEVTNTMPQAAHGESGTRSASRSKVAE